MELFMIKTGFCVRTLLLALLFSVISPLPLAYSELSLFLAMIFNVHIYILPGLVCRGNYGNLTVPEDHGISLCVYIYIYIHEDIRLAFSSL